MQMEGVGLLGVNRFNSCLSHYNVQENLSEKDTAFSLSACKGQEAQSCHQGVSWKLQLRIISYSLAVIE